MTKHIEVGGVTVKGFRCHECYYYRRHYVANTTWGECYLEPKHFAEFTYGEKVDGRKRACEHFIFSTNYARYEHKREVK